MHQTRVPRLVVALAGCIGALGVVLSAAEIVGVATLPRDGRLLVSFEMAGAYTDEIRAAISSGLPTTFSYDVELRRTSAFWFDRIVASATVSASVRYDNLTRLYQVSRMQDGRVEEARVLEAEAEVRRLLTKFERLPLFSTAPLEANAEYALRVRAQTRPRNTWFVWPWGSATASGGARFTFLP